jgi:hypothetical protein
MATECSLRFARCCRSSFLRYILLFATIIFACCSREKQRRLFKKVSESQSGITFVNQVFEDEKNNIIEYEYFYNGGGVGIGDFNNDGFPDVFLSGNMTSSKLYLNRGNLEFQDVTKVSKTETTRWCSGVTTVDINQDGWLDIFISVSGPTDLTKGNYCFVNQGLNNEGIPVFTELAVEYNLAGVGNTTQTVFFDFDKDGDLDAYMLKHHQFIGDPNSIRRKPSSSSSKANDRLFRQDREGEKIVFRDVTENSGIIEDANGLGVGVQDLDKDGWDDLYISNDYLANDQLYINNRDGTFRNEISTALKHQSYSAMGNDIADINNDGLSDIMVVDMLPSNHQLQKMMLGGRNFDRMEMEVRGMYDRQYMRNTLQLNNGKSSNGKLLFSEIGNLAGVSATDWSWSPLIADFDNDGFRDLIITNGFPKDITNRDFVVYKSQIDNFATHAEVAENLRHSLDKLSSQKARNFAFRNTGKLSFENKSDEWGFEDETCSYGSAYADLDLDGDLDLVVNNLFESASLYENTLYSSGNGENSKKPNFIRISFSREDRIVAGTMVSVWCDNNYQFYQHHLGRGYQSTVENIVHFGLGNNLKVDSILIEWPNGEVSFAKDIAVNQVLYSNTILRKSSTLGKIDSLPIFEDVTNKLHVNFRHEEQLYVDFKNQPLVPHLNSQNGPGVAVGDVDGDGLEDFFVGGAFRQSGAFFIRKPNGEFRKQILENAGDKFEEDMGVLLFDADGDHDLDLYVTSGGSEFQAGSKYYSHRLYVNNGKGEFTKSVNSIPSIVDSGSSVAAADYDRDGDLDLFVCGRLQPNAYPMPGKSHLLINETKNSDQPVFVDRTKTLAPEASDPGMITQALWTDFDNDGLTDLLVVGEWMPITFLKNFGNGQLKNVTGTLSGEMRQQKGWWNTVAGADFDNDGDTDYIVGNLGLNSKYSASVNEPLKIYAKDYDGTGTIDPVITYAADGKEFPSALRDDMISQINFMRRRFPTYQQYSKASYSDLFSKEETRNAYELAANNLSTIYLENISNDRKLNFRASQLPIECQVAPVFGIVSNDFDGDGQLDVILTGNFYSSDATGGRHDASVGTFLKGNGKGQFTVLPAISSGLFIDGDCKGIAQLNYSSESQLVVIAQNADSIKVLESKKEKSEIIQVETLDALVVVSFADGSKRKIELTYGSSYLSSSSRKVRYPAKAVAMKITDSRGTKRKIK